MKTDTLQRTQIKHTCIFSGWFSEAPFVKDDKLIDRSFTLELSYDEDRPDRMRFTFRRYPRQAVVLSFSVGAQNILSLAREAAKHGRIRLYSYVNCFNVEIDGKEVAEQLNCIVNIYRALTSPGGLFFEFDSQEEGVSPIKFQSDWPKIVEPVEDIYRLAAIMANQVHDNYFARTGEELQYNL